MTIILIIKVVAVDVIKLNMLILLPKNWSIGENSQSERYRRFGEFPKSPIPITAGEIWFGNCFFTKNPDALCNKLSLKIPEKQG